MGNEREGGCCFKPQAANGRIRDFAVYLSSFGIPFSLALAFCPDISLFYFIGQEKETTFDLSTLVPRIFKYFHIARREGITVVRVILGKPIFLRRRKDCAFTRSYQRHLSFRSSLAYSEILVCRSIVAEHPLSQLLIVHRTSILSIKDRFRWIYLGKNDRSSCFISSSSATFAKFRRRISERLAR